MEYIILEDFNAGLNIKLKTDDSGEIQIYTDLEQAELALVEALQAVIIPLDINIIEAFRQFKKFGDKVNNNRSYLNNQDLQETICTILQEKEIYSEEEYDED